MYSVPVFEAVVSLRKDPTMSSRFPSHASMYAEDRC